MRYVVVDVEATCWKKDRPRSGTEIIEIGAVMLASAEGPVVSEFCRFVKPSLEPMLSEFCRELTTITQEQVNSAEPFPVVFREFLEWVGSEPYTFCSWGGYDKNQFRRDSKTHNIEFPSGMELHINLKSVFASQQNIRQCGMKRALELMEVPLQGQHHRGIDDAKNIAQLAMGHILPKMTGSTV